VRNRNLFRTFGAHFSFIQTTGLRPWLLAAGPSGLKIPRLASFERSTAAALIWTLTLPANP